MKQLCIRFNKKTLEKMAQNAQKNVLSLSEYVRRLVEIGLKVEAVTAKNSEKSFEKQIKELWQKDLSWILETAVLFKSVAWALSLHSTGQSMNMAKIYLKEGLIWLWLSRHYGSLLQLTTNFFLPTNSQT